MATYWGTLASARTGQAAVWEAIPPQALSCESELLRNFRSDLKSCDSLPLAGSATLYAACEGLLGLAPACLVGFSSHQDPSWLQPRRLSFHSFILNLVRSHCRSSNPLSPLSRTIFSPLVWICAGESLPPEHSPDTSWKLCVGLPSPPLSSFHISSSKWSPRASVIDCQGRIAPLFTQRCINGI